MSSDAPQLRMTAAEYLAWERGQSERHEYRHGEVFSMAGGTPRHNALVAAVTGDLHAAVRGGDCRVLSSDQRIVALEAEHYVYADVSVVCGPMRLAASTTDVLANPTVVIEVLSKSTETYDRGIKWDGYQRIPSVTDYLLVAQSSVRMEHYQRNPDGSWHYRVVGAGGRVSLANGLKLDVDAVYAGVLDIEGD